MQKYHLLVIEPNIWILYLECDIDKIYEVGLGKLE